MLDLLLLLMLLQLNSVNKLNEIFNDLDFFTYTWNCEQNPSGDPCVLYDGTQFEIIYSSTHEFPAKYFLPGPSFESPSSVQLEFTVYQNHEKYIILFVDDCLRCFWSFLRIN